MIHSVALVLAGLVGQTPSGESPKDELAVLRGEWLSSFSRSPGSQDALRQRTLEIGVKGKADGVRLSWTDWCGRTSFAGDTDYAGRVLRVEAKDKKRVLVLAGEKGAAYRVEFELTDGELRLEGTIKDVKVGDTWKRKPALKK